MDVGKTIAGIQKYHSYAFFETKLNSKASYLLYNMTGKKKSELKLLIFFMSVLLLTSDCFAQSRAHEKSRFAIINPFYDSQNSSPKSNIIKETATWIYGAGELESWRLQLLRRRKDSAKLMVGYPGSFYTPSDKGSFRLDVKKALALHSISFITNGSGALYINDILVGSFRQSPLAQKIVFNKKLPVKKIQFDIVAHNEPPALLIESASEISTFNKNWQWKAIEEWEVAYHYPQNVNHVPPHQLEDPRVPVAANVSKDGLYDFGKELFGYLVIKNKNLPAVTIGESQREAMDTSNAVKEQPLTLEKISQQEWRTKNPVAFRYVYVVKPVENIYCEAIVRPAIYSGAFACSDSTVTRIYMNSAYTLRLCMHDFLLDGMKRDRLPWAGDLVMSMMTDAYSFADAELARRSLVALGKARIREKNINGIIDYSLWWIIAQDNYQLYFDYSVHLLHEWNKIKEALSTLETRCDTNGFLQVKKEDWLFIDWVDEDKWTALQILWWWAQNSGVKLANRMSDFETANYWNAKAEKLKKNLVNAVWDKKEKVWFSAKDSVYNKTRHPNFLSVLSGITDPVTNHGIKSLLENESVKPVGTPYMAGFEAMAIAQLGDIDYMLSYIKKYWGGMLNKGATTFWEAYDHNQTEQSQYAFYDRPYGKSLCHAWSASPAMILPAQLFGLKPLEDGWTRFTIQPNIGWLKWASVCVPVKNGNIIIDIENKNITISIPQGTTLTWKSKTFAGPQILKTNL